MKLSIPKSSVEYVVVDVASPSVIDVAWPVAIAIIPKTKIRPEVADWKVSEWQDDSARLLIGPGTSLELASGHYDVWVKVTAAPEDAVRRAGSLEIV